MEPLFEIRYTRDEALFREFFRRTQLMSPIYIFAYLYSAHCLFNFLFYWFVTGDWSQIYLIALPCGLLGYLWYLYQRSIRITLNRDLESNGGKPIDQHLIVTENAITGSTPTGSADLSFERIKKVRQSKNLIILYTKAKQAFVFPKAAFTRGTAAEFLAFLKTKGIK